ncbi:MAG TPA: hypothetical protein VF615_25780 [Longimicrobiaceae bacterium]|jgi:hypothetical protein
MGDAFVYVLFCCNHGEDGQPTGIVYSVDLPELGIKLETGWLDRGPVFREERTPERWLVRIGRRRFPIRGYHSWVGNWCWDQATVSSDVASSILGHLVAWGFTLTTSSEPLPLWARDQLKPLLEGSAGAAAR